MPPLRLSGGLFGRLLSLDGVPEECFVSPDGIDDWWFGVGGNGRTLSGGHLLVTNTVAGSGIAVPPPFDAFEYGTGSCLQIK